MEEPEKNARSANLQTPQSKGGEDENSRAPAEVGAASHLHPLVHRNESTAFDTVFKSTFTSKDLLLTDHRIHGVSMLPGVAQLEMAREAIARASGITFQTSNSETDEPAYGIQLRDIVWLQPAKISDDELSLCISIEALSDTEFVYDIFGLEFDDREILYCQGKGGISDSHSNKAKSIDLSMLSSERMTQAFDSEHVYSTFSDLGFAYGPSYQGIVELELGADNRKLCQVLAKLNLAAPEQLEQKEYWAHPSLLDSAIQASIGIAIGNRSQESKIKPMLPFSLECAAFYFKTPKTAFAWVRYSNGSSPGDAVQNLDITVCDEQGNVCVELTGLNCRPFNNDSESVAETLLLKSSWEADVSRDAVAWSKLDDRYVVLVGFDSDMSNALPPLLPAPTKCHFLQITHNALAISYQKIAEDLLVFLQGILERRPRKPVFIQMLVHVDVPAKACFSSLESMLRTANREAPQISTQCITLTGSIGAESLSDLIQENAQDSISSNVLYENGQRRVRRLEEISNNMSSGEGWDLSSDGVTLITGGLGHLGKVFSRFLAERAEKSTIILCGRSTPNLELQDELGELRELGVTAEYYSVEISDRVSVQKLFDDIRANYGPISNIIHLAGSTKDGFLINKKTEEIAEILAPKVSGLINLDELSQEEPLKNFICFSSIAAMGNAGQGDYSMANAFMDSYAKYRAQLVKAGSRQGKMISINWPFWAEGGIYLDESNVRQLNRHGLVQLTNNEGLIAFEACLDTALAQVWVLHGDKSKILEFLAQSEKNNTKQQGAFLELAVRNDGDFNKKALQYFLQLVSDVLNMPADGLDPDVDLDIHGFDALMSRDLVNRLEDVFGSFPKALPFEVRTVRELSEYFIKRYSKELRSFLSEELSLDKSLQGKENQKVGKLLLRHLMQLLADVLNLPLDSLDSDAALDTYGFDSLMVVDLTNRLEDLFDSLPKTLLFEVRTVRELSEYLTRNHIEAVQNLLNEELALTPAAPDVAMKPNYVSRHRKRRVRKSSKSSETQKEPVAIIGMSGRYPQANNMRELWENLKSGRDCIEEIPPTRWDYKQYLGPKEKNNKEDCSRWGGFIQDVDQFDPLFFSISPREAEIIDPQERLFLQCVYETIEDAGYTRQTLAQLKSKKGGLRGNVGVFVGVMYEEYQLHAAQEQAQGGELALPNFSSSIANRISYFCDFHGPSIAVDTMCSSSLTALHMAAQEIRNGDCDVAIAGGVNLTIHPNKYLLLKSGNFTSNTGHCAAFGVGGDGYVPAEGVGSVLLKPLSQAIEDKDHIYGVIRGTAVNHGGKTNGYTVPNPIAQGDVIAKALRDAEISPQLISYVEAHGTGTTLGDPIEISGLTKAFNELHMERGDEGSLIQNCAIGSVKSNIGHCESAAGIAGVSKVLLQLKHKKIVPSLHSKTLNPNIDFGMTPFRVQQKLADWIAPTVRVSGDKGEFSSRIAGVSGFGAGGSNAHIIIEEYEAASQGIHPTTSVDNSVLIVMSAKTESQLIQIAKNLLDHIMLEGLADIDLPSIAYTLQVGREALEERIATKVTSVESLKKKLESISEGVKEDWHCGSIKKDKESLSVFTMDDAYLDVISKWVAQANYDKLLTLWVKGLKYDWSQLYSDVTPARISLPTYPFAKRLCWAAPPIRRSIRIEGEQIAGRDRQHLESDLNYCFVTKNWKPSKAQSNLGADLGCSVIIATQNTKALAELLQNGLDESLVLMVDEVTEFEEKDWNAYSNWIDLVGCEKYESQKMGWVTGLQEFIKSASLSKNVFCVTRNLESYESNTINLAGASRVGLYRMLHNEYRRIYSKHIDIEGDLGGPALEVMAKQVLKELSSDYSAIEICFRNNKRYEAAFNSDELRSMQELTDSITESGNVSQLHFANEQVLLIAGGTGGIGLTCARHFVRNYGVRKLLLLGRESLPPREEWKNIERLPERLQEKIRNIEELENEGAQIITASIRLNEKDELEQSLSKIIASLGPISGVLHCAGSVDMNELAFVNKTQESISSILSPKWKGLQNLLSFVETQPLKFCMLFSSVSAANPSLGVGQSDYAMANTMMDYIAQSFAGRLPVSSVQWPNWTESGMGEVSNSAYEKTGLLGLNDKQGLALLDYLLNFRSNTVVLPALVDPAKWMPQQWLIGNRSDGPNESTSKSELQNSSASVEIVTPSENKNIYEGVSSWLTSLLAEYLKLHQEEIEANAAFADYGIDSIFLVEIIKPINEAIQDELDPSVLFEYDSVELLTAWLIDNHATVLRQKFQHGDGIESAVLPLHEVGSPPDQTSIEEDRGLHEIRPMSESLDIAVVGMSCRFPGAPSLEGYWELLLSGRSAISEIPKSRWGREFEFRAGLVENLDYFDPEFFGISKHEASMMDPQARLLLEECLNLICHAGYTQKEIKGQSIGVYLGVRSQHNPALDSIDQSSNIIRLLGPNYLASNLSQFFDLQGSSLVVDTACSSALVAMDLAIQSLQSGRLSAAIVGGASIMPSTGAFEVFDKRGLLNKTNSFHVFDGRAEGVILGEGIGMTMLKTVEQAELDGDTIYAVVKGIAANNNGRTAGPVAPNIQAQKTVMAEALSKSGKRAKDIEYIEVNGTGSEVTDLLELKAIEDIYRQDNKNLCALGSIKPNIGHPLCAEGIASFLKVVLMLHYGKQPPFLSGHEPMKHYDFESSPFQFPRKVLPWTSPHSAAAINCFADGGTNVHMVLESADREYQKSQRRMPVVRPTLNMSNLKKASLSKPDNSGVLSSGEHKTKKTTSIRKRKSLWSFEE